MSMSSSIVVILYSLVNFFAAAFALHEFRLLRNFGRHQPELKQASEKHDRSDLTTPYVTVQLPLYNERFAARRAIDAIAHLDYPRDRIQIQVLDDSDDETRELVDDAVAFWAQAGVTIETVRRDTRAGFKAGALANGLKTASGEFIAIFDADFVPKPEFLHDALLDENVFEDPSVAFVQTRWEYLNNSENRFTRIQGMLLDRHFFIQKPVRENLEFVTVFNGSGGIWRRSAIEDSGGWSADTLTEDLDLSYRAAMRGWRGRYLRNVAAPSELPTGMLSFKQQQRRWARGSIQTLRKLAGDLLFSRETLAHRYDELLYIAGYAVHAVMLANLLLWPWAVVFFEPKWLFYVCQVAFTACSVISPWGFTLAARERDEIRGTALVGNMVLAMVIGFGLMVSNTIAVVAGLLPVRSSFERTPKRGGENTESPAPDRVYVTPVHWSLYAELITIIYCMASLCILVLQGRWFWAPPCLLWAICLAVVVGFQLRELWGRRAGRAGAVSATPRETFLRGPGEAVLED